MRSLGRTNGRTYSGHTAACAAAFANLDVLEGEDLVSRVAAFEPEWVLASSPRWPTIPSYRRCARRACEEPWSSRKKSSRLGPASSRR